MNNKYITIIIAMLLLITCVLSYFIFLNKNNNQTELVPFSFSIGRNTADEIAYDWQHDSVLVGAYTIETKQNESNSSFDNIPTRPDTNFTDGNTSAWVYNYISELSDLKLIITVYGNGTFITHEVVREGTGKPQEISIVIDSSEAITIAMQHNGSSVLETNNISYITYSLSYYYDTPCWIIGYLVSDDLGVYQITINAEDRSILEEA